MRSNSFQVLINLFMKFPGIGSRQARRFAYYLLEQDTSVIQQFILALQNLKQEVAQCPDCFRFFARKTSIGERCEICSDTDRDRSLLMIVEKDADLENVRKADVYTGLFFVLGGLVPILDEAPETKVRSRQLKAYLTRLMKEGNLKEIIIAVSANPDGDHTANYLHELCAPFQDTGLKITELGRGLSTGSELEYSDRDTLKSAITNRH
jgi:recombination protein RecR